jgi:HEPN domain-containing protein
MRLKDAKALLGRKRWAAAYYLTGYVVECALKSCVLRHLDTTGIIFSDRDYLKKLADCWTHDLGRLVNLAGLDAEFGRARQANAALEANWGVTKDWEETSRYEDYTEAEARALYDAVAHDPDGVFLWIQSHW